MSQEFNPCDLCKNTPRDSDECTFTAMCAIIDHEKLKLILDIIHQFHEKIWIGDDTIGYSLNGIEIKRFLRDTEQFAGTKAGRVSDFKRELELNEAST